jgi:hypothetical protein
MQLGDYTGLPLNEAGWRKAESRDEAVVATHERQCIPHVVTYSLRGPATIRFSKVVEPDSGRLLAYSLQGSYGRPRMIWMDGREHPSDLAPHTWVGFSTGTWERNTLVVSTTHVKMGWLQRNGAATSDLVTMEERFIRHGDYLTTGARPTAPRRSCACPGVCASPGTATRRSESTPMPDSRPAPPLRQIVTGPGDTDMARDLVGRVGAHPSTGRFRRQHPAGAAARRHAEGRHDRAPVGLSRQERRARQRRNHGHGIFRSRVGLRVRLADGAHHRGRSDIPHPAIHHEHALQARARRVEVDADAVRAGRQRRSLTNGPRTGPRTKAGPRTRPQDPRTKRLPVPNHPPGRNRREPADKRYTTHHRQLAMFALR